MPASVPALMKKEHLTSGDKIRYMICDALLERGFGRALHTLAAAVQHTGLNGTTLHLEGAAMSPLLQAAHAFTADEARQLRSQAIDVTAEPMSPTQSSQPLITDPAGNIAVSVAAGFVAHKPEPDAAAAAEPATVKPTEPAREGPPQDKPPFSGVPADGAHYMAFKERTR
ncbi:MAG: hypothetical protein WBV79_19960 [Rhodomicrobium sp.]